MNRKMRLGLAGISFAPFWAFRQSQYKKRISQLRELTKRLNARLVVLPRAFQDAKGALEAARKLNDKADLAILDICTFPEGKAAETFFCALKTPVILWSRGETEYKSHIGHNSFCGANFLAGVLALKGRRFRSVYGEPHSAEFRARISTATRLVAAANSVSGSRIGLLGEGIVPKFYDIDIQPEDRRKLEERWNIRFVSVPMKELVRRAEACSKSAIEASAGDFRAEFKHVGISDQMVKKQVRLLQAITDIAQQESFAGLAVRCWPELQKDYEAWPCPSLSQLNEKGIPAACEGDPGGALDMLLAAQLSRKPSTLMDIVDWSSKSNALAIWHCGPTACSWADKKGARLLGHNVDGRTSKGKAASGLPGVVDMQFARGPVTIFRTLGAIDDEFVVAGELAPNDRRRICGSFGTVTKPKVYSRPSSVDTIRDDIFKRTLPHHYVAVRGNIFR